MSKPFKTFTDQIKKDEIIHENLIYAVDKAMNEFQNKKSPFKGLV